MKKSSKKYFGFTLVELIIVITILAILATVAFVSFQNYTSQTRDTKRLSDLSQISKGVEVFQIGAGNVPIPDNPKTLTGGNSTLLVGKINYKVLKSLSNNILDPVSGTEYTYATIGNGKYYQIGADSENLVTSIVQNTFADSKSSIVKGNYLFDPSLPSLIISSGSNLYDPNNCFVVNGGTNLVSNNTNCTSKANISLKNFDSSLVGYWDMESLTGTMLKDLSGNGNDGICYNSGTMINCNSGTGAYLTGTLNSKGLAFDGIDDSILINSNVYSDNMTYVLKIRPDLINTAYHGIIGYQGPGSGPRPFNLWVQNLNNGIHYRSNGSGVLVYGNDPRNYGVVSNFFELNKDIMVSFSKNGKKFNLYKNSKKIILPDSSFEELYKTGALTIAKIDNYFSGVIDEVKIYNRALSDEEILSQANISGF